MATTPSTNATIDDDDAPATPPKAAVTAADKKAAQAAKVAAAAKETHVELVHGRYVGPGFSHDAPAMPGEILKVKASDAETMISHGTAKAVA